MNLIIDTLLKDLFYKNVSSIKELIDEEREVSNILFPPEAANPRREALLDILRASNAFCRLQLKTHQLEALKSWLDKNVSDLSCCSDSIEWWSGKGPIFSHLMRISVSIYSLSRFGIDITASESKFHHILSKNVLIHPIITKFLDNFEVSKKVYVE